MNKLICKQWRKAVIGGLLMWPFLISQAQQLLTEEDAVRMALSTHPSVSAAKAAAEASRAMEGAAFSLPNPAVGMQSPTGEFYVVGINQNLDFPSVYVRQRQVLKAATGLTESESSLATQDLSWQVRTRYIAARYALTRVEVLAAQDSMFQRLLENATLQYELGQIDALEKSYASLQANTARRELELAKGEASVSLAALLALCGADASYSLTPWTEEEVRTWSLPAAAGGPGNAQLDIARKQLLLADATRKLERSRWMPGLQLGYMNQAGKETPVNMRWQAGITVPLWFWQYSARSKSADALSKQATEKERQVMLEYGIAQQTTNTRLQVLNEKLGYFLTNGLPEAQSLVTNSTRFFEAGETDFVTHLRIVNDAVQVQLDFIETSRELAEANAMLRYLNGQ